MPAAERGREEVLPEMNQRSSAITARRKTRFVVRRGWIGVGSPVEERREREKWRGGGAKRESVPVPVLERVSWGFDGRFLGRRGTCPGGARRCEGWSG